MPEGAGGQDFIIQVGVDIGRADEAIDALMSRINGLSQTVTTLNTRLNRATERIDALASVANSATPAIERLAKAMQQLESVGGLSQLRGIQSISQVEAAAAQATAAVTQATAQQAAGQQAAQPRAATAAPPPPPVSVAAPTQLTGVPTAGPSSRAATAVTVTPSPLPAAPPPPPGGPPRGFGTGFGARWPDMWRHTGYFVQGTMLYMTVGMAMYALVDAMRDAMTAIRQMDLVVAQSAFLQEQVPIVTQGKLIETLSSVPAGLSNWSEMLNQYLITQRYTRGKTPEEQQQFYESLALLQTISGGSVTALEAGRGLVSLREAIPGFRDYKDIVDALAASYKNFGISHEEMMAAMREGSGAIRTTNLTLEEYIATIGHVAKRTGDTGAEIGAFLRTAGETYRRPETQRILAQIGVGVYADPQATQYRNLLDVVAEIDTKFKEGRITAAEYNDALTALFGPRRVTQANAMVQALDEINASAAEMAQRTGEAGKQYETMLYTMDAATNELGRQWDLLVSKMGLNQLASLFIYGLSGSVGAIGGGLADIIGPYGSLARASTSAGIDLYRLLAPHRDMPLVGGIVDFLAGRQQESLRQGIPQRLGLLERLLEVNPSLAEEAARIQAGGAPGAPGAAPGTTPVQRTLSGYTKPEPYQFMFTDTYVQAQEFGARLNELYKKEFERRASIDPTFREAAEKNLVQIHLANQYNEEIVRGTYHLDTFNRALQMAQEEVVRFSRSFTFLEGTTEQLSMFPGIYAEAEQFLRPYLTPENLRQTREVVVYGREGQPQIMQTVDVVMSEAMRRYNEMLSKSAEKARFSFQETDVPAGFLAGALPDAYQRLRNRYIQMGVPASVLDENPTTVVIRDKAGGAVMVPSANIDMLTQALREATQAYKESIPKLLRGGDELSAEHATRLFEIISQLESAIGPRMTETGEDPSRTIWILTRNNELLQINNAHQSLVNEGLRLLAKELELNRASLQRLSGVSEEQVARLPEVLARVTALMENLGILTADMPTMLKVLITDTGRLIPVYVRSQEQLSLALSYLEEDIQTNNEIKEQMMLNASAVGMPIEWRRPQPAPPPPDSGSRSGRRPVSLPGTTVDLSQAIGDKPTSPTMISPRAGQIVGQFDAGQLPVQSNEVYVTAQMVYVNGDMVGGGAGELAGEVPPGALSDPNAIRPGLNRGASSQATRTSPAVARWRSLAEQVSRETGIPTDLLLALIAVESSGDPNAVNESRRGVPAYGLMQISGEDIRDPLENIRRGAQILRQKLDAAGGNLQAALDFYSGGAGIEYLQRVATALGYPLPTSLEALRKGAGTLLKTKQGVYFPYRVGEGERILISQGYGEQGHAGIDFPIPQGTPLYSPVSGVVIRADMDKDNYGGTVWIKDDSGNVFILGHMSEINEAIKPNRNIPAGILLGKSGGQPGTRGAGKSTGPHLHLEIRDRFGRLVNPETVYGDILGAGLANITKISPMESSDTRTLTPYERPLEEILQEGGVIYPEPEVPGSPGGVPLAETAPVTHPEDELKKYIITGGTGGAKPEEIIPLKVEWEKGVELLRGIRDQIERTAVIDDVRAMRMNFDRLLLGELSIPVRIVSDDKGQVSGSGLLEALINTMTGGGS